MKKIVIIKKKRGPTKMELIRHIHSKNLQSMDSRTSIQVDSYLAETLGLPEGSVVSLFKIF
jgi:hypothetical protein